METLLIYFIKVASLLALVWLCYAGALRRHTFYTSNRWYFLTGITLALLLPILSFPKFAAANHLIRLTAEQLCELDVASLVLQLAQPQTSQTIVSATDLIVCILGSGMLLFFSHFCFKLHSFLRLRRHADVQVLENTKVFILHEKINPFSFWGHIFINPAAHTKTETAKIIAHEMFHIKQKHTIDIILTELLVVFFWFNPFAWLLRKAMRQNLEYLADRHVLKSGFDIMQYQCILVRTSVSGTTNLSITHNFTFSNLKKRIIMMNKKPSAAISMLKYLLLLPIFAFAWMGMQARDITKMLNEVIILHNQDTVKVAKSTNQDKDVLTILDGEIITNEQLKAIDPNTIESITVLKDKNAISLYGEKAKNGVILITTKK